MQRSGRLTAAKHAAAAVAVGRQACRQQRLAESHRELRRGAAQRDEAEIRVDLVREDVRNARLRRPAPPEGARSLHRRLEAAGRAPPGREDAARGPSFVLDALPQRVQHRQSDLVPWEEQPSVGADAAGLRHAAAPERGVPARHLAHAALEVCAAAAAKGHVASEECGRWAVDGKHQRAARVEAGAADGAHRQGGANVHDVAIRHPVRARLHAVVLSAVHAHPLEAGPLEHLGVAAGVVPVVVRGEDGDRLHRARPEGSALEGGKDGLRVGRVDKREREGRRHGAVDEDVAVVVVEGGHDEDLRRLRRASPRGGGGERSARHHSPQRHHRLSPVEHGALAELDSRELRVAEDLSAGLIARPRAQTRVEQLGPHRRRQHVLIEQREGQARKHVPHDCLLGTCGHQQLGGGEEDEHDGREHYECARANERQRHRDEAD
mmetsp:Transcript_12515/g.39916  ORF Transcript_12515/g.39916 Transcript_12515/m.39916 type:complete len:436 (-) Transcript_12515:697-2004(-)